MLPYNASNTSRRLFQQSGCHYRLSQLMLGDTSEISNADLGELNQLLPSLRQLTFHQANFVCVSLCAVKHVIILLMSVLSLDVGLRIGCNTPAKPF